MVYCADSYRRYISLRLSGAPGRIIRCLCLWGGAVSAVWKNPKYLHSKLHFNVLVASADLTGMHRSDISLRMIGALFQYSEYFRNF